MSVSLEDQRRALLEQIEASRAVYRRMLAGEPVTVRSRMGGSARTESTAGGAVVTEGSSRVGTLPASTPRRTLQGGRSKAVQWAMDHPFWVAGAVAMLVLLLPRAADARRRRVGRQEHGKQLRRSDALAQSLPQVNGAGVGRALLAAALLLLRDPARLKTAGRLFAVGWHWLQRWRSH